MISVGSFIASIFMMALVLKHSSKWLLMVVFIYGACAVHQQTPPSITSSQMHSYPLRSENDLDILINEIGNAGIVLLGEASHGTAEYYNWRAAISKRLISEKGFNIIAVEGDYIDMYRLDECVRGVSADTSIAHELSGFIRWPQWLWCNREFENFAHWIKERNSGLRGNNKIKLCGLDVFNFGGTLDHIVKTSEDSATIYHAKRTQECIRPYGGDALRYSEAISKGNLACNAEVYRLWQAIQKMTGGRVEDEKILSLVQQASVVLDGEQYFRLRNSDASESWNGRDRHMQEIIRRLLRFYGHDAKLIVWAHNTHIGDARYTDMPTRRRTNIGELLRKEYGERKVFTIGFGSYCGELIAGETWGAPSSKIKIRPAKQGSWEQLLHEDGAGNKILLSRDLEKNDRLKTWTEQRSIGVVYRETYIPSLIPRRYDAFVFFDTTHAIHVKGPVVASKFKF